MRVVVGLSGGVDSAVAAWLLKKQGHEVIGAFMRNWKSTDPECTAPEDLAEAERVAEKLEIPLETVDFSDVYWQEVFEYFLEENRAGRTPNPDILCNSRVKFGPFLEWAQKKGADKIATGHYAQVEEVNGKFELKIPTDRGKDQTYFLHRLNQTQLGMTLFPLAEMKKNEVRKIARQAQLTNAERKDSTGICFIGERNYSEFLQKYLKKSPGKIIEKTSGKVLGEHQGLAFYTLGQRRELHIGGVKDFAEAPWFVVEKDFGRNELVVSQDESFLMEKNLKAKKMHWIAGDPPSEKFEALGKIRYRDQGTPCTVRVEGEEISVEFKTPVRAITPGQSLVLYDQDVCLGGGEIL
ncbi:MAG: tRNA 2-thiouridine(34) synthase MnmA [Candidatus Gracilibacteria bacterium]|nr:tRNA 2-thiouridine(34) synthase MnmA [Candidatus Gracilibacteria bacterium]